MFTEILEFELKEVVFSIFSCEIFHTRNLNQDWLTLTQKWREKLMSYEHDTRQRDSLSWMLLTLKRRGKTISNVC